MAGKYLLTTLGCKVNQYESQQLREALESAGLHSVRPGEDPDIAVVNTCAVTGTASRKNRQAIRRAARGGRTSVVVVGCGASADADTLHGIEGVIAVFGHDVDACSALSHLLIHRFGDGLAAATEHPVKPGSDANNRPDVRRNDGWMKPAGSPPGYAASTSRTAILPTNNMSHSLPVVKQSGVIVAQISSFAGHQRAFLKVQDGCDAFCTYCIIPQLRPALRSKPVAVAVAEARKLVQAGHKEIILTGVFLGAYGRETALRSRWMQQPSPLAGLVRELAQVEGLERLRLSSLEPGDVDEALLEALATCKCCVPHLHLPMQSGSGGVLRRMNRQYTIEAYLGTADRVRRVLDRPAISTDIIIGFPGESEGDFQESLEVARQVEFCRIHAFPFSPREKTAASRWKATFVPGDIVRERMRRLGEVEVDCSLRFRQGFVGEVERVIVEESRDVDAQTPEWHHIRQGRADRYFMVHFRARDVRLGELVSVRIDRVTPVRTHGTCLSTNPELDAGQPTSSA